MSLYDLTGNKVSFTYGRLVQIASGSYYDGFGNLLNLSGTGSGTILTTGSTYPITSSWANNVVSSSYSLTASYVVIAQTASYWSGSVVSSSYSDSSSYSNNSNSSSYALSSSYAVTASYSLISEISNNSLNAQDILIYVKNTSGAIIPKGKVVRIVGADNSSNNPTIELADFRNENNSANTLGFTNEEFSANGFGYVMTEGKLLTVNTSNFTSADLLYLSSSGTVTNVTPQPPYHGVRLGQVIRSQINNGSIYVRIDNGYELEELHNVLDTSTTSSYGDLLMRNGSVWINSKNLTGSYTLSGSLTTTSNINCISVTASLNGTSSWSNNSISSSVSISSSYTVTASYSSNSLTASYFGSGSDNYFPFWSSNKLSYDSLISQSNNKIAILSDTSSFLGDALIINKSDPIYVNNNPTIDASNSPNQTLMLTPNVVIGGDGNSEHWNRFNSDGTVDFLGANIKFTSGGAAAFNSSITIGSPVLLGNNKLDVIGNISASAITASRLVGTADSASYLTPTNNYTVANLTSSNILVTGTIYASNFSASTIYITSSEYIVSDNIITLNALNPYRRYAGLELHDSGSNNFSSLLWDSQNNYLFVSSSESVGSRQIILGPDNEVNLISNYIPLISSSNTITSSIIYQNNSNIGVGTTNPLDKLSVSGSIGLYAAGTTRIYNAINATDTISIEGAGGLTFKTYSGGFNTAMVINTSGNVGIGTTSPSVKLAVDGEASFGDGSKLTMIGLDINSQSTPNFIKIRTKIPFASGAADFTVNIKGFRYGSAESTNLMVCWHYYTSIFYNPTISSAGSYAPTVKLSAEDWDSSGTPKVCIVLVSPGYWPKLYVESMYSSAYNDAYADGWDWVDADATGTGNNLAILSYKSNFGNSFVMLSDGNVGIGTTGPLQKLDVRGIQYLNSSGSASSATSASLMLLGQNTKGGSNYHDFLYVRHTLSSATNPQKWFRIDNAGVIEIINDAYNTAIFSLTNAGVLSTPGGGTSDIRTKQNVEYIYQNALPTINQLKPVKFEFKNNPNVKRHGFIAQDVLSIKPDLVLGDGDTENGTYGLDYDGILALTVKALQEANAKIEQLESRISQLENK